MGLPLWPGPARLEPELPWSTGRRELPAGMARAGRGVAEGARVLGAPPQGNPGLSLAILQMGPRSLVSRGALSLGVLGSQTDHATDTLTCCMMPRFWFMAAR